MRAEAGGLGPELGSQGWAAAGDTGPRGAGARGSHSAVLEPGKACLSLKPQTWKSVWLQEWRCCPGEGEGRWACWRGGPQGHPRPQGLRSEPTVGSRGRGEGRLLGSRAQIFPWMPVRPRPVVALPALRSVEMTAPERSRQVSVSLTPPPPPRPQAQDPPSHHPGRTCRPCVPRDCPSLQPLGRQVLPECPQSPG